MSMTLPLSRLATLVGSIPREPPATFEEFRTTTYPKLYNICREVLFLMQKIRLEEGPGIKIEDLGTSVLITNLNP